MHLGEGVEYTAEAKTDPGNHCRVSEADSQEMRDRSPVSEVRPRSGRHDVVGSGGDGHGNCEERDGQDEFEHERGIAGPGNLCLLRVRSGCSAPSLGWAIRDSARLRRAVPARGRRSKPFSRFCTVGLARFAALWAACRPEAGVPSRSRALSPSAMCGSPACGGRCRSEDRRSLPGGATRVDGATRPGWAARARSVD